MTLAEEKKESCWSFIIADGSFLLSGLQSLWVMMLSTVATDTPYISELNLEMGLLVS